MNLKSILLVIPLTIIMSSCGNKEKGRESVKEVVSDVSKGNIAYVDVDSLQKKYQYYVDAKGQLETKVKEYQNVIQQKERSLQQMQISIQQRMQNGGFSSETQYKAEVAKFQKQQEAYAKYCEQAQADKEKMEAEFGKALQDSLDNFLAEYNKTKHFSLILNKAVTLYAEKGMDITDEVAAGLNKRYNKK